MAANNSVANSRRPKDDIRVHAEEETRLICPVGGMMADEDIHHRRLRQMPTADLQLELDHFEALSAEHTHALGESQWLIQLWREEQDVRKQEIERRAKAKTLPRGAIQVLDRRRIDEAKAELDLITLVEETVPLRKRGKEYVGLCPWHDDTRPSLSVNAEKGLWHCHGCQVGGDAIDWVRRRDELDFKGAIRKLWPDLCPETKSREVAGSDGEENTNTQVTKRKRGRPGKRQAPPTLLSTAYSDGTLVETIYDAFEKKASFAVRRPKGETELVDRFKAPDGVTYLPAVDKGIRDGHVLLPSQLGELPEDSELFALIEGFIYLHWDCTEIQRKIATYYVVTTHLYDQFVSLPYLHLRGPYGSGKSQGLQTLGAIAYHAINLGTAASDAVLYRTIDRYRGTLLIDELDTRRTDVEDALTKILNVGYHRGGVVWRCNENDNQPEPFAAYGPKIFCTRRSFGDTALQSRCLTFDTVPTLRDDVPLNLPPLHLWQDAIDIRNMLLAYRFAKFEAARLQDWDYPEKGLEPRLQQILLPLKKIINDDKAIREIEEFTQEYQRSLVEAQAAELEALVLEAIIETINAGEPLALVTIRDRTQPKLEEPTYELTSRKVGETVRKKLGFQTYQTGGRYYVRYNRGQLLALCRRYGKEAPRQKAMAQLGLENVKS